jgi:hypothetical protein
MIDELLYANGDLNEPCCPDVVKRVCFACRRNVRARLAILAHNLAVGAALCAAYERGASDRAGSVPP